MLMFIYFRFTNVGFFEEFSKPLNDCKTLKEIGDYIENHSLDILKEYLESCNEYTKEDVEYLLNVYTYKAGVRACHWSISGEV